MKLTAQNKTIDFFEFDTSEFDRVFLALSGGTDSAMLLYLTCIEKPDWKIVCHTGIDKHKDPWVGEYAAEIVDFMQKKFPHVDIVHEQYKFNSLDPLWLYRAEQDWNAHPNKEILPTIQGHSKAVAAKPHKHELRKKYDIKLSMHAITANPPVEVQKEFGFLDVAEPRRNLAYDEFNWKKSGKLHYTPFINVDKRFIAELYEQHDLLNDLFPLTHSCIGFEKETDYFTKPCEECFWCYEKMWAFGTYDPT